MTSTSDFETVVLIAFADPESSGIDQPRALQLLSELPNPAVVRDEEGNTLLHYACRNQWDDAVRLLVENHKMVSEFECILLEAFTNRELSGTDQTRALQLLSQHPKPVAAIRGEDGRSLLYCAYRNEWDDVVDELVKRESVSGYEQIVVEAFLDPRGEFPYNDQAYALELLSRLPNLTAIRDKDGGTLLHYACQNEWGGIANMLMEEHIRCQDLDAVTILAFKYPSATDTNQARALQLLSHLPNAATISDAEGNSLLHYACRNDWKDVAKVLIEKHTQCHVLDPVIVLLAFKYPSTTGINQAHALQLLSQVTNPVVVRDEEGNTLFYYACRNGWGDVASLLIEKAHSDSAPDPTTVSLQFQYPFTTGTDQACALQLLSQLPNPAAVRDEEGNTLLHYACRNQWDDAVQLLVEKITMESKFECFMLKTFLNPELTGIDEAHALQLLSQLPNPAVVRDEDGNTLLHYACKNGWGDVASVLLEKAHSDSAPDPTTVSLQFQYPFTTGTNQACALQLLSQLPNPAAVRDDKGNTLLHYACRNQWDDAVTLLVENHEMEPKFECILLEAFRNPELSGINHTRALQLLSRHPKPVAAIKGEDGRSLLYYACRNEWGDVVDELVKRESVSGYEQMVVEAFLDSRGEFPYNDQVYALKLLCRLPDPAAVRDGVGNTLLQHACMNGWSDVVNVLVEEYHCDPTEYQNPIGLLKMMRTNDDFSYDSAIHCACEAGSLYIVKYLIEHGCDPQCRGHIGVTPLHITCVIGSDDNLSIAKYLVEQGCNPECKDELGATSLHYACMNGHSLNIVKFLVTEHHCNPLQPAMRFGVSFGVTPLHLACFRGNHDVVEFLISTGKADKLMTCRPGILIRPICKLIDKYVCNGVATTTKMFSSWAGAKDFFANFLACRRSNPFHPAFKVFVMGNYSAGKSTLVKAIQSRMTNTSLLGSLTAKFKKVSGVKPLTAGIIPVPIESKQLGSIIMYDLAGQYQYYSSHAALLEKLVASPGALLMVVVDLSKSKEEIIRTLQYWNSFIENHCSQSSSKPSVVLIGSHADIVKSQQEDPAQKSKDILENLQEPNKIILLNCTQLASDGLTKLCDVIARCCSQFHRKFSIDLQVHFLYAFLFKKFKSQTACRVSEIISLIEEDENTEMEIELGEDEVLDTVTLLPQDTAMLSQHLTTLSEKGQFLYLRNDQNIEDSWVILQQEMLLSEVNGTVFAPETFKEHHDISSSTGVVPFSKIKEVFPRHNPEMIISFLSHLEFCQQIAASEASMINGGHLEGSQQSSEAFYFFPALVSKDRPKESCKSIEQTHYKCGWSLQCIRPDQFLSPRFLHVLLLQLAFSFALAPETTDEDKTCPVLQRRCNVWKAGIHWQNRDGVEAIVEVMDQNTAVTVMMGCLEGREVACVGLRSEVIRTILDSKERFCGAVELRESLIHPAKLSSYPMKTPKLLSFAITELATAVSEGKQVVTCKQGDAQQMLSTSELLYFEPYTCFTPSLLAEMFKDENLDKEVPDVFYLDAGKVAHTEMKCFKQALTFNESEFEAAISIATQPYRDSIKHHCYLLFRTWALCSPNPTYQALRTALDRFSVFCGRNPLLLAGQVPSFAQSTSVPSKGKAKSMPTKKSHDTTADFCAIPCKSDKPHLQELECLQGRGGRRVRVIEEVAGYWEDLALALHFKTIEIEHITDLTYQTEDACREVLRRWLQGQGKTRQPVNWSTLIDSLIEAGFVDVAEELQEVVKDPLLPPN